MPCVCFFTVLPQLKISLFFVYLVTLSFPRRVNRQSPIFNRSLSFEVKVVSYEPIEFRWFVTVPLKSRDVENSLIDCIQQAIKKGFFQVRGLSDVPSIYYLLFRQFWLHLQDQSIMICRKDIIFVLPLCRDTQRSQDGNRFGNRCQEFAYSLHVVLQLQFYTTYFLELFLGVCCEYFDITPAHRDPVAEKDQLIVQSIGYLLNLYTVALNFLSLSLCRLQLLGYHFLFALIISQCPGCLNLVDVSILLFQTEVDGKFDILLKLFKFGFKVDFSLSASLFYVFLDGLKPFIDFLNYLILYFLVLCSDLGHRFFSGLLDRFDALFDRFDRAFDFLLDFTTSLFEFFYFGKFEIHELKIAKSLIWECVLKESCNLGVAVIDKAFLNSFVLLKLGCSDHLSQRLLNLKYLLCVFFPLSHKQIQNALPDFTLFQLGDELVLQQLVVEVATVKLLFDIFGHLQCLLAQFGKLLLENGQPVPHVVLMLGEAVHNPVEPFVLSRWAGTQERSVSSLRASPLSKLKISSLMLELLAVFIA